MAKQGNLIFGTAGVPRTSLKPDTLSGLARLKELGLGAMELEFVRGVHMGPDTAKTIRALKEKLGLKLTCHAPYYINLASLERDKVTASIKRIMDSARIASICGAQNVTFHAGFYMGRDPEEVYQLIKIALVKITHDLRKAKIDIRLTPELTGKASQFGSLDELIRLAQEIKGLGLCIDFSHLHARSGGEYNSYAEFSRVLKTVRQQLGKESIHDLHIHISGIKYTAKGEREHLDLAQSDLKYQELLRALKDIGAGGIVICESPNLETDALLMQKYYTGLGNKK